MSHPKSCHCTHCIKARKIRRFNYDHGIRLLKDADPLRARIQELKEMGISQAEIAEVTGISIRTLSMISCHRTKRVHTRTYAKIMNFSPEETDLIRNEKHIDSTPSIIRVRALVALGYRQDWIASQLGRKSFGVDIGTKISRRRALDILDLVTRVGDTPGPSVKAAVQARNKGWRKPAEYDEDLFYDPHWDGTEPEQELHEQTQAERILEDYDFVVATTGATLSEAAERLGVKKDYLEHLVRKRAKRLVA